MIYKITKTKQKLNKKQKPNKQTNQKKQSKSQTQISSNLVSQSFEIEQPDEGCS